MQERTIEGKNSLIDLVISIFLPLLWSRLLCLTEPPVHPRVYIQITPGACWEAVNRSQHFI